MPDEVVVDLVTEASDEFEAMRAADPATGVAGGEAPPDPADQLAALKAEVAAATTVAKLRAATDKLVDYIAAS